MFASVALIAMASAESPKPLVLYRIGVVPVEMREGDAFGTMLVNDGWEEDPSPRYIVAIAKTRTVLDTKDLQLFTTILKTIPKGSTIFGYDSCTVPRSWGLKDKQLHAYDRLFEEMGLKVSENTRVTCYCESVAK